MESNRTASTHQQVAIHRETEEAESCPICQRAGVESGHDVEGSSAQVRRASDDPGLTGFMADCPEPGCTGRVQVHFAQEVALHDSPVCAWALSADPLAVIKRCRETYTSAPDPNAH